VNTSISNELTSHVNAVGKNIQSKLSKLHLYKLKDLFIEILVFPVETYVEFKNFKKFLKQKNT
jgi:hypothetical protein